MHEAEIKEYLLKTPPFLQWFACLTLMSPRASHAQVCSRKPGYGSVPSALFLPSLRRAITGSSSHSYSSPDGPDCLSRLFTTFNVETSTIVLYLEMSTIAGLFLLRSGRLEVQRNTSQRLGQPRFSGTRSGHPKYTAKSRGFEPLVSPPQRYQVL